MRRRVSDLLHALLQIISRLSAKRKIQKQLPFGQKMANYWQLFL
jgi:hypothetical protein